MTISEKIPESANRDVVLFRLGLSLAMRQFGQKHAPGRGSPETFGRMNFPRVRTKVRPNLFLVFNRRWKA